MLNLSASAAPLPALAHWFAADAEPVFRSYAFGQFLLQPGRQSLSKAGVPVRIGGRALDILTMLVERPGQLVGKRELLARVWPQPFVDEANLKANMALLRRVLGERHAEPRFIATVVGRGYRFVSPVCALDLMPGQRSI